MYPRPLQCHDVRNRDLYSVTGEQFDLRPPLRPFLIHQPNFRVYLSHMELLVCDGRWAGPGNRWLLWTNCNALQRFQCQPVFDVSHQVGEEKAKLTVSV